MAVSFSVSLSFEPLSVTSKFGARLEAVGTDLEDCILARRILAQLGANAGEEDGELEGFGDVIVRAGFKPQTPYPNRSPAPSALMIGERKPCLRISFTASAPVHVRQADIHDGEVDTLVADRAHRCAGILGSGHVELLVQGELLGKGSRADPDHHPRREGGELSTSDTILDYMRERPACD